MEWSKITDFGAVGDGVHDDTPALAAAMQAAQKSTAVVYFPPGRYRIHPIRVPGHITLLGASAWGYAWGRSDPADETTAGRAVLLAASGQGNALLDLTGAKGTRIQGLTLQGERQGQALHGIYIKNTGCEQNVTVEDCRITGFSGSGVRLDNSWVAAIRRCLIMNNAQAGIDYSGGVDGWIIDNQLAANGWAGIFAGGFDPTQAEMPPQGREGWFGTASITITANRVEWNALGGILLYDSDSIQITGCTLDHNFGPGVGLWRCRAMACTGNIFRSNGADRLDEKSTHLLLENCRGTAVTGNSLYAWMERTEYALLAPTPFYGMVLRGLTGSAVTGNALFESGSKELVLDGGGHTDSVIAANPGTVPDLSGRSYPGQTQKE
ncbi:MAG: glycosyl hydrolase family 28-related protein [Eubacteriales bacterium]|nr:glycosyl hydrolase family 28-related protein [Eubacteriales bacterium]